MGALTHTPETSYKLLDRNEWLGSSSWQKEEALYWTECLLTPKSTEEAFGNRGLSSGLLGLSHRLNKQKLFSGLKPGSPLHSSEKQKALLRK